MSEVKQFKLPDVGEGLTEADIVAWHVKPGDSVSVNQVIVEIETAKAVVELPSPYEGVVTGLLAEVGQTVDVGTPIITVDVSGDAAGGDGGGAGPATTETGGGGREGGAAGASASGDAAGGTAAQGTSADGDIRSEALRHDEAAAAEGGGGEGAFRCGGFGRSSHRRSGFGDAGRHSTTIRGTWPAGGRREWGRAAGG